MQTQTMQPLPQLSLHSDANGFLSVADSGLCNSSSAIYLILATTKFTNCSIHNYSTAV